VLHLDRTYAGETPMKKVLILLGLLAFGASAEEEVKNCTIHDHGGGATIIACPDYVITKTSEKTMICRLMQGSPNASCTQVP
jgi:hypothetical protein